MSSGGKGGAAAQSKNYYGTLAGAICWGPLDWLKAVILNGNYIFQGNLTITTDVTDLTGSILDPTLLAPGGYLKLYRGTETQPADAALAGHPPYRGTVMLAAKNIFFGQDSGTAPNLQIIGGRKPRVPTAIVAAIDNVVDDEQINPIAAWAEILLDERGGSLDISEFDAASWLVAAHWCAQDQAHKDYTFCSPLVAEQSALRDIARNLLDPFNGFCRWTNAGKLACNIYEWGVDPGGLLVLDAHHWTKKPNIPLGDWNDVPTEILLSFNNRDYEYQDDSHIVPNARAAQIRQVDEQLHLERRHVVTRIAQAHRHAVEYNRRIGTAPTRATIRVRQPFVIGLSVGDKIRINTNPEPGGAGLSQLVRLEKLTQDRTDEAMLTVVTDNLVPANTYTPVWTPPAPAAGVSPPLVNFLGVPLPPNAFGWPPSVALLATRPAAKIVGFEAYFGQTHAGAYADLGQQNGFAVRATLVADILAGDGAAQFNETDGLSAADAGLAANTPGGNATEAGDNILLALLATLDGNGRIALDGSGTPIMEFVSIIDRVAVAGATFNYTILRGRLGTTAQAWASATTKVWIVPRANIVAWRHSLLSAMLGGVAYFRLVSFTQDAVDDSLPVPELSVNLLPATSPLFGGALDGTGPDEGVAPNPVSGVTVTPGLGLLVFTWTNPINVPLMRVFIYEAAVNVKPAQPSYVFSPGTTAFFRTGLAASTTDYLWIEVQGVNGRRTSAGSYSGTTRAGIDLSDIVAGLEMVGIVNTLPTTGNYDGRLVFLTTDKKLYRFNGTAGAWTSAVPAVDITGQLTNAQIADLAAIKITGQLTNAQIADLAATKITGQLTDAQVADLAAAKLTGQITQTQITDGSISTAKLAANAITAAKIAALAITANELAANAVTAAKIGAGEVITSKLAAGAVTANELAANAITAGKIAAAAIVAAAIGANEVIANVANIANLIVTGAKIADATIGTAKIIDANITTAKVADANITTAKIGDLQVSTLKIGDNAVTIPVSLFTIGSQSAGTGNINTFLTIQSLGITTDGTNPVLLWGFYHQTQSVGGQLARFKIQCDGSDLFDSGSYDDYRGPHAGMHQYTPGAGAHTYALLVTGHSSRLAINTTLMALHIKK